MKKLSLLVMLFTLGILIQGCSLLVIEEKSEAYDLLSDQYNQYIMNDIVDSADFREFMNEASDVSATSVFMVETDILDSFNRVRNTLYGSGTLIFEDTEYLYILTTYQVIDLNNENVKYFVTDAYGRLMTAEIFASDIILGLGLLRVEQNIIDYEVVDLASFLPLSDELVLMISNNYPTQNIQKLGYFLYQDETSYMEVASTQNANGAPIFNLKLEVIGIQYMLEANYVQIIDFDLINDFINPLLPI
jgi:hypothetical protein